MEKMTVVGVTTLVETVELNIAEFILNHVDKKHFECGENISFDIYDKNRINKKLRKKSEKELAKITFAGKELYLFVRSLDIEIHRSAFRFLAFLADLEDGVKTL